MQRKKQSFSPYEGEGREGTVRQTVHTLLHTMRLHRAAIENTLADLGIHHSQHRMLVHLHRHGGEMEQKVLPEELEISPAAVAVTLRKLEERGLILRTAGGGDGRCKTVTITNKGEELLRVSHGAFTAVDLAMFASLSEEELSAFRDTLLRMQEGLACGEVKA